MDDYDRQKLRTTDESLPIDDGTVIHDHPPRKKRMHILLILGMLALIGAITWWFIVTNERDIEVVETEQQRVVRELNEQVQQRAITSSDREQAVSNSYPETTADTQTRENLRDAFNPN